VEFQPMQCATPFLTVSRSLAEGGARESEPFTLLDPVRGQVAPEFLHGEIVRLTSIEYRRDNVRSKECAFEDPTHVTFVKSGLPCDRPPVLHTAIHDALPQFVLTRLYRATRLTACLFVMSGPSRIATWWLLAPKTKISFCARMAL